MTTQFYSITDRKSTNPTMSHDGGDYDFGRTIAVEDGVPVAVRFWTSADAFDFCPHSGSFNRCDERCEGPEPFDASYVAGWKDGELLTGDDTARAAWRYEQGSRFFLHFEPVAA